MGRTGSNQASKVVESWVEHGLFVDRQYGIIF